MSIIDMQGDRITDYEYGERLNIYAAPSSLDAYRLRYDGTDTYLEVDTNGGGGFEVSLTLSGHIDGIISVAPLASDPSYQVVTISQGHAIYGTEGNDSLTYGGSDPVYMARSEGRRVGNEGSSR